MAVQVASVYGKIGADTRPFQQGLREARSGLSQFGSRLQSVGGVVTGVFAAIGTAAVAGLAVIGRQVIDVVGHAQMLELGMKGVLRESLMFQQVTEQTQARIQLTKKEQAELANLKDRYVDLTNAIGLTQMARGKKQGDVAAARSVETLRKQERNLAEVSARIAELDAKSGSLAVTTQRVWKETMTFEEAEAEASKQTQDLLGFIDKLSIASPFERRQVEEVARLGLVANMSTEAVKGFTEAFLDYAAAHGVEELAFAADQFLQLRKIGKLTTIDMRQLRRLGIDLSRVLGVELGMSVDQVNEKLEQTPEFMDEIFAAFERYVGKTGRGSAAEMAQTLTGLASTMGDIREVAVRNLFQPMVEAASPHLIALVDRIAEFLTGDKIKAIGETLGEIIGLALSGDKAAAWTKFVDLVGQEQLDRWVSFGAVFAVGGPLMLGLGTIMVFAAAHPLITSFALALTALGGSLYLGTEMGKPIREGLEELAETSPSLEKFLGVVDGINKSLAVLGGAVESINVGGFTELVAFLKGKGKYSIEGYAPLIEVMQGYQRAEEIGPIAALWEKIKEAFTKPPEVWTGWTPEMMPGATPTPTGPVYTLPQRNLEFLAGQAIREKLPEVNLLAGITADEERLRAAAREAVQIYNAELHKEMERQGTYRVFIPQLRSIGAR